ncbi:MAG TPA: hypothetical protein DEF18_04875 [Muricauda sp.]|uniref:Lipoprotein n=1 Tax=Flagellimonas aurea TaxID=2915619 RepID=A0ABS3G8P9_9FLAO|nr:hypothetical protein [Allomuricauda aurea]MBC72099.1 hypothetical protein [Allomuricauda sp.]MBO0355790.1 hypothetical protein [Allomuricauda aurea]HBU77415.1 hypothetical protein [Allomuricauda sp.]|tara:strand:- start:13837 stop:14454 length:618 start_codon:yes stop_codon:yes gene_type:complete
MGFNSKIFYVVVALMVLSGCTRTMGTETAFLKWLDDPDNGCVKAISANGFTMSLKYLPPEYLAYMESIKGDEDIDALQHQFDSSMTLLFTVVHNKEEVSVSNYNVPDMVAYRERANVLNFELRNHLYIKGAGGERIPPVLATYENTYEVGGKKSFYVVFPRTQVEGLGENVVDVVFDDPFMDTGISHFMFNRKALEQIPTLQFIN